MIKLLTPGGWVCNRFAHPRAARGRTLPKPASPTNTPSSAAVTRMRLHAATGMAMSHAALTLASAVGRSASMAYYTETQLVYWPCSEASEHGYQWVDGTGGSCMDRSTCHAEGGAAWLRQKGKSCDAETRKTGSGSPLVAWLL